MTEMQDQGQPNLDRHAAFRVCLAERHPGLRLSEQGATRDANAGLDFTRSDSLGLQRTPADTAGGNVAGSLQLARKLAAVLGTETALVTSLGDCVDVVAGLLGEGDLVLVDERLPGAPDLHRSLGCGTSESFDPRDPRRLEQRLAERSREGAGLTFVLIQTRPPVDATAVDFALLVATCRRHGALLIADLSGELGTVGELGLGALEQLSADEQPDLLCGSLHRFGTDASFLAGPHALHELLADDRMFDDPTVSARTATRALEVAFGEDGADLRRRLLRNARLLRLALRLGRLKPLGRSGPVVTLSLGDKPFEAVRDQLEREGLRVELATTRTGEHQLRLHVSVLHTPRDLTRAAELVVATLAAARSSSIAA